MLPALKSKSAANPAAVIRERENVIDPGTCLALYSP